MISGSIPSGTIDNPEGVEEGDIIIKSPFTVVARIVTYEGDSASSSPVDITSWGTGSALGSGETYTDVDLLHTSASGIDSFSIVYGVYGNISSSDAPNSSVMISASDSGWTVDGSKSDDMSLSTTTTDVNTSPGSVFNWKDENGYVLVSVNEGGGRCDEVQVVANTHVTWDRNDPNVTPVAGTYSASITISIQPD